MHTYSFEKLRVWNDARQFVVWIYDVVKVFPPEERFGIASQMKRAAISVVANIAEGSSRKSRKDQAHFYQVAYSSLTELLNHMILAADLSFLDPRKLAEGREKLDWIALNLGTLRNTQLRSSNSETHKPSTPKPFNS